MIKFASCKCQVTRGEFNINDIPLNCPAVWRLVSGGHTVGIFQLEKNLGQDWAKRVRPDSLEELAALTALLRPGPLEAGMTQDYVDIKFGRKQNSYLHPFLQPILEPTYGCLVYQEQAIRIATDVAGFSPEVADDLRKAIGKKKPELMAKLKTKFIVGCKNHSNISQEISEEIFSWIEKCQRYCVAGDTIIRRPNGGRFSKSCMYSIEHMYRVKNDLEYAKKHGHTVLRRKWRRLGHYGKGLSLCDDGRIRPNVIRDIQPAGHQQLYKLTLENGAIIRITSKHKFPTPNGEKTLSQLSVGDDLYLCGTYEQSDFKAINRFSNQSKNEPRKYGSQCGFPTGIQNPCYTNGSYTNFMEYKANSDNICEQCGKTNCRIETSHIDGDRTNSFHTNLRNLCVSCHKKYDYAHGRTKRGEKGYPVEIVKIKLIEPNDIEQVWNVTMDTPNHNFVINNNIVTSNSFNKSHAISYGMIAYQTAWVKCHFPHEFFTSYLTYSQYKGDPKVQCEHTATRHQTR
jgi:DNA polymerase-3 subunit alpha